MNFYFIRIFISYEFYNYLFVKESFTEILTKSGQKRVRKVVKRVEKRKPPDFENLERVAVLGIGGFATVYLVQDNKENYYALKKISKQRIVKTKFSRQIWREKKALNSIKHDLIIKLFFI